MLVGRFVTLFRASRWLQTYRANISSQCIASVPAFTNLQNGKIILKRRKGRTTKCFFYLNHVGEDEESQLATATDDTIAQFSNVEL